MDGAVQIYRRPGSPHWQASCSVAGRQRRTTTKEESLARAKDVARDWYLGLMGKYRAGELKEGKTFKQAADRFIDEYEAITLGQPTDRLFPALQRELFNAILDELGMKEDREGQRRTFYSLRHTYICMRLMEGADIYQIAKNCRTSVEMIETYYASHIKNTLDAAAINVRKAKPTKTRAKALAEAI
jgi:integrase